MHENLIVRFYSPTHFSGTRPAADAQHGRIRAGQQGTGISRKHASYVCGLRQIPLPLPPGVRTHCKRGPHPMCLIIGWSIGPIRIVPQAAPSLRVPPPLPPPPPPEDMGRCTQIRPLPPRTQASPRSQSEVRVQIAKQIPKSQTDPFRQSVSALQASIAQDPPNKPGWHVRGNLQSPLNRHCWATEFDTAKSDGIIATLMANTCRVIQVIVCPP